MATTLEQPGSSEEQPERAHRREALRGHEQWAETDDLHLEHRY